jgi:hypothetical protein
MLSNQLVAEGGSPTSYGTTPSHQLWDWFDKFYQTVDNRCPQK